jgi:hypothetical protein
MNTNEQDLILADFIDNKITLKELLEKFPELAEESELLNRSIYAMNSLPDINTNKLIELPETATKIKINRKIIWYAAASILFIAVLTIFLFHNQGTEHTLTSQLNSIKTEEKIKVLWATLQQKSVSKSTKEKILLLASTDKNSSIRYLALENLIESGFQLSEKDIIFNISKEQTYTNQTAWMELWIKLYPQGTNEFLKWLETEGINPIVKSYGMSLIKSTAKL